MKPWLDELWHLIPILLGTTSPWMSIAMAVTGLLLFTLVFRWLANAMEFHQSNVFLILLVLVLSLAVILAATVAARLYLEPRYGLWPVIAAPIVAVLPAGLFPLLITRAKYLRGILALLLSLAAAAAIMTMTRAIGHTVSASDRSVDRIRGRQEETDTLLSP